MAYLKPKMLLEWKALTSLLVCRSVFTHFWPNLPIKLFLPHDPPKQRTKCGKLANEQTFTRSLTNCSFSSLMTTTVRAGCGRKFTNRRIFPNSHRRCWPHNSRRNGRKSKLLLLIAAHANKHKRPRLLRGRVVLVLFTLSLSSRSHALFLFTFATCEISRRKRKCASVSGAFDELIGSRSTHTHKAKHFSEFSTEQTPVISMQNSHSAHKRGGK